MKKVLCVSASALLLSLASLILPVSAQSLKPEAPAPLQAGVNRGQTDNFIGNHYWYFEGGPGQTRVHATFTSMGLFGNAQRTNLSVTLSDASNTWHTTKILTSEGKPVDCTFDGNLKSPTKLILTVAPPANSLIRVGGSYELEATGAVSFGEKSTADPIIATYKSMNGFTKDLGACKFLPDGTIQTANGYSGSWKVFDPSLLIYAIDIEGEARRSLKFVAGQGLVDDQGALGFQLLR